ncbi:MAG: hypothetical protein SPI15_07130 [Candidatus Faecousia sp.]|nr:hypothetical protein [Clostridiales bacterium]MDY6180611.1 hypothetical protein [Candidatus Faecousia sp.]
MKNKSYLLNMVLTAGLGVVLLVCVLVKTFLPGVILPALDIPCITLISVASLLLEHFWAPGAGRNYLLIFLYSAISFAVLPMAAGMAGEGEWWKLALAGGVIFTGTTWIFESVTGRISSGNGSKMALILTALGIYLAVQCFTGIFL